MEKNIFYQKAGLIQARTTINYALLSIPAKKEFSKIEQIKSINRLKDHCVSELPKISHGKQFNTRLHEIFSGKKSFTHANLKELELLVPGVYDCFVFGPENSNFWGAMRSSNNDASTDLCQVLGLGFGDLSELSENHIKFLLLMLPEHNLIILSYLIEYYRCRLMTSTKTPNPSLKSSPDMCYLDYFIFF